MPGYAIHLAIGKRYAEHNHIEQIDEFMTGTIMPDLLDKKTSHYGEPNDSPDLKKFLGQNALDTPYNKGYFLHLITDYLFYNKFLDGFSDEIYHDYNKINKLLIEKYELKIPKEVEDVVKFENGIPKILDYQSVCKFIEAVAQIDFEKIQALKNYLEEFKIEKETDISK